MHSLLRVVRNGLDSKLLVDNIIDKCATHVSLRGMIEEFRLQAENETDKDKRKQIIRRGVQCLKRYFLLIAFACYLDQCDPSCLDELETFQAWCVLRLE